MEKMFGIILIGLAVWVGVEVFTKGTHGAFGGILAPEGVDTTQVEAPLDRIADHLDTKQQEGRERFDHLDKLAHE